MVIRKRRASTERGRAQLLRGGALEGSQVSNQSAGYCPDLASWPAVATTLDLAGPEHHGRFSLPAIFRRCPRWQERNLVKDDFFACVICNAELPRTWNVDLLGKGHQA